MSITTRGAGRLCATWDGYKEIPLGEARIYDYAEFDATCESGPVHITGRLTGDSDGGLVVRDDERQTWQVLDRDLHPHPGVHDLRVHRRTPDTCRRCGGTPTFEAGGLYDGTLAEYWARVRCPDCGSTFEMEEPLPYDTLTAQVVDIWNGEYHEWWEPPHQPEDR